MKVLSLLQPWANFVVTQMPFVKTHRPVKQWETRSWAPSVNNLYRLQNAGMLIHASLAWKKYQKELIKEYPFDDFFRVDDDLITGKIIGWVKIGRVIKTEDWKKEFNFDNEDYKNKIDISIEHAFGDYNDGRYAWEITDFKKFKTPTPAKGNLSLWEFDPSKLIGLPL